MDSDTAALHAQIEKMGTRIQNLEGALASVHPSSIMLKQELLRIKFPPTPLDLPARQSAVEPPPATSETDLAGLFGSLTVSNSGESKYFGSSAATEVRLRPFKCASTLIQINP